MNKIEEIQKLKSLLDQEAITQDEYNLLKKNILERSDDQQTCISTPIKTIGKSGDSQSVLEETTQSAQKQSPDVLTQNNINELVATTNEFWSSFHQSLALPYSNYNSFKDDSLDKWVKRVSRTPDLKTHLNILFEYVLLKGEFLIVFYQGFILTNYRLLLNDINAGKPSIPLSNLINYNVDNGCKIVYEKNGQSITLTYNYFMYETIINSARARFQEYQLNKVQLELLSKSISELKISNPNLEIPIVDLNPSLIGIQNTINKDSVFHTNKPSFLKGKFFKYAMGIALFCLFSYWVNHPSSSNSSTTYPSSESNYSDQVKHCRYCGAEIIGAGYYHVMDGCEQSKDWGDMCSQKCCYESWNATHRK